MDDDVVLPELQTTPIDATKPEDRHDPEEVTRLTSNFESRLIAASLRTEAVRAGMIDLDCLKLVNLTDVRLDENDTIIGGRAIMDDLRRNKPWLFRTASSSSAAVAPSSQPVRQKTAMDMTDEEYFAARSAVTKYNI